MIRNIILTGLFIFTGCSNEMRYDMMHDTAKANCRSVPNPDERRACEAKHDIPYQEYKSHETYPESR